MEGSKPRSLRFRLYSDSSCANDTETVSKYFRLLKRFGDCLRFPFGRHATQTK